MKNKTKIAKMLESLDEFFGVAVDESNQDSLDSLFASFVSEVSTVVQKFEKIRQIMKPVESLFEGLIYEMSTQEIVTVQNLRNDIENSIANIQKIIEKIEELIKNRQDFNVKQLKKIINIVTGDVNNLHSKLENSDASWFVIRDNGDREDKKEKEMVKLSYMSFMKNVAKFFSLVNLLSQKYDVEIPSTVPLAISKLV